jgi:NADH-quinone oxidoreductase subunit L
MTVAGITAAMFHLMTHAFFKALLFLGAGSVMHAMGNVIDIRQFGGLRKRLPVTHWTFLIGSLALAGFPVLTGFWSKDAILGAVHDKADGGVAAFKYVYGSLWIVGLVTAALTAFYTFRAYFRTFYGEEKIPPEAGDHAHEADLAMRFPLGMLAGLTLLASVLFLVYPKSHLQIFPEFLSRTPSLQYAGQGADIELHFHWDVAGLSGLAALAGIGAAAFLYLGGGGLLNTLAALARRAYVYQLSQRKFLLDEIYYVLFVWPLKIAAYVFRFFDNFFVDGLVNLGGWLPRAAGAVLRPLGIGLVQFYALAMMLGLIVLIGSLLWWG